MSIPVVCPECLAKLNTPESAAGKKVGNSTMLRNVIGGVLVVLLGVAGCGRNNSNNDPPTNANPGGPNPPNTSAGGDLYDIDWRAISFNGDQYNALQAKAAEAIAELKQLGVEVQVPGYAVQLSAKFGTPDGAIKPEILQKLRVVGILSLSTTWNDLHLSDAGMRQLGQLRCLNGITIREGTITDGGFAALKQLPSLWILDLAGTPEKPLAITGEGFRHLTSSTKLYSVSVGNAGVTDEGLVHIGQVHSITSLSLQSTKITDAGLVHLKGLSKLQDLDLQENAISGTGLGELGGLPALKDLNLYHCPITDDGLAAISRLSITKLRLQEAKITDNAMPSLLKMTKLEGVSLIGTGVTDTGLKTLASHPNLEWLWLQDTAITDDGLLALAALPKLNSLDLSRGGKVTQGGIEKFKRAKPNVKVDVR